MQESVGTLLDGAQLGRITELSERYVSGREALFRRRVVEGRIGDGHGDLLSDDIFCLEDGPRIIDCLEFDDRLRYSDVVEDVAFLAMDLERLGAEDLAAAFLADYRALSGDPHPASLAHHYIAPRCGPRSPASRTPRASRVLRRRPGSSWR